MRTLALDCGLSKYADLWRLQKEIHSFKQKNKSPDLILLTEHYNVYTLGKAGKKEHLLVNESDLEKNKIDYFEIDRGGDLTYHGPGQIVCYPIFDLNNYYLDTHRYLRDLESVIMAVLKDYDIDSQRDEQYTGVWVGDEKICSIGIKISRWITMHGLAFNINNDLLYYDNIIPCGIFHKGVTTLSKLLGKELNIQEVKQKVLYHFGKIFSSEIKNITEDELTKYYNVRFVNPASYSK